MTHQDRAQIEDCYVRYCAVIKPLIANIESLSEKIPLSLFNEIRAFNDHIARCYYLDPDEDFIKEQITKAQRHIERITLDCFKCLNVILYQRIELFERQTKNVDLTVIDNGEFFPEYSRMKLNAANFVRLAKLEEARNSERALDFYQDSYNVYTRLVEKIDSVSEKVKWAKVRFTSKRIITIIAWVVSVIISAILSAVFSCEIVSAISEKI